MKNIFFIILMSSIIFSCESVDPNKVNVTGTMVWIESGSGSTLNGVAVSGAKVSFYPAGNLYRDKIGETTTGSDGKFSFQIAPGDYDIIAFKGGSTSDVPPPGSSSMPNVEIPEGSLGADYDVGEFIYN